MSPSFCSAILFNVILAVAFVFVSDLIDAVIVVVGTVDVDAVIVDIVIIGVSGSGNGGGGTINSDANLFTEHDNNPFCFD